MRIGIVIGRIGGVDGVALETEKWITVLERLGHECHVLTGELEREVPRTTVLPELGFSHPRAMRDQRDAFFDQQIEEGPFLEDLHARAAHLADGIEAWMERASIELLLPENASTLPFHLTMGMALRAVMERTGVPAVAHDHDFRWERGERYRSRYPGVERILEECFPPNLPDLRHAVINSNAREVLRERLGVEATVVPNVMDFEAPFARRDEYNRDMLADLGLPGDCLALFQVTRIVRRKGIETAIELIHRLGDPRFHLVITGSAGDDFSADYLAELEEQSRRLGIDGRVHFLGHRFDNFRATDGAGDRVYSLEDAYAHAAAMTYFSTYEGFGNAFVEALLARVPIFVNAYEPVYEPDIGSRGFDVVTIRDGRLTDEAVDAARRILEDPGEGARVVEENFELGRRNFSYEVLAGLLEGLLAR